MLLTFLVYVLVKDVPQIHGNFVDSICHYIVKRYSESTQKTSLANLIGCDVDELRSNSSYFAKLNEWIISNTKKSPNYIDNFLKKLDEFNLDEYIHLIHFDDMKVPSIPFQLPTSKNYYGIEAMKQGELDFFKSTVLSKSKAPVFMCSDMPMEDIAEDVEFGKKWMFAIAMMLKKGIHLDIIHNIDRPFKEMMLGLESWIPIYMTGLVSPYYLKGLQNNVYCHFNYVSGNVALIGECIKGFHGNGKYYLTNNKDEVAFYTKKAHDLLSVSSPLMNIYKKDSANVYEAFMENDSQTSGTRRAILSTPPIYTLDENLLLEILGNNNISKDDKKYIKEYVLKEKQRIETILKNNTAVQDIAKLSKEDFEKYKMSLSLSGCFYEKKIYYQYEDYLKHFELTEKYAKANKNYNLQISGKSTFRNIQIYVHEGKWVMISKDTDPSIHFVIHHSKLRNAIENFIAPIED